MTDGSADHGDSGSGVPDPVPVRIGDRERNAALEALGEHLTEGRIDLDEYGERSAMITVAKSTADISEVFADLPAPHPALPALGLAAVAVPPDSRIVVPTSDSRSVAQKVMAAAVPVAGIVALVLFFALHISFWIFLLPAVFAVIGGAIWGSDWKQDPSELRRRQEREDRRRLRDDRRGELGEGGR